MSKNNSSKITDSFNITELTSKFLTGSSDNVVDIITFMEAEWGLNFKPRPSQKFILRCFYGLELDSKDKYIPIYDNVNEKLLYQFSETEFLEYLYNEGRCNTNSVSGKNFKELDLVLGRRSGKCRYVDDLIATSKGSITFKELLNRKDNNENIKILTYHPETFKLQETNDFKIWNNGIKDCFELKTKNGTCEKSSSNHPYLIWKDNNSKPEFIKLEDVRVGDRIAISSGLPVFGDSTIGINKSKLLGYLIGDGGITINVGFTSENIRRVEDIQDILNKEFPNFEIKELKSSSYGYSISNKRGRKHHIFDSIKNKYVYGKNEVKEWLKEIGCLGLKSKNKKIPECILRGSKEETKSFLNALYACDGWASLSKKINKPEIGFCSASKCLALGVKHLLTKLGIMSNFYYKKAKCNGKIFDAWVVAIYESSAILKFSKEIGIFSKELSIDIIVDSAINKNYTSSILHTIPKGVWKYIDELKISRNLKNKDFLGLKNTTSISPKLIRKYSPMRRKVIDYGKNVNDQFLIDISSSDILWDTVESISPCGQLETVDLCIEGTHIIAGEIVSHNSIICSTISSYELYKLVKRGNPLDYYGFPPHEKICILNVAPSDEQAKIIFDQTMKLALACPYTNTRIINATQENFMAMTDYDMDKNVKKNQGTINVLSGGCSSNALRGQNSIIAAMDEAAFFLENGGRFSGKEVYKALTPSTTTFKNPNGTGDGKIILISSPYAKYGMFYEKIYSKFRRTRFYFDVSNVFCNGKSRDCIF